MIELKQVEYLAVLARIDLDGQEAGKLRADLDKIIGYFSQLQKLTISEAEIVADSGLNNVFRTDGQPHPSGESTEKLLAAAPERQGNYFKVKKIK